MATINVDTCAKLYVSGGYGFTTYTYSQSDEFKKGEETFPLAPTPPARPPYYWNDRFEAFNSSARSVSETIDTYFSPITLSATGNGEALFKADENGNVEFYNKMNSASDECKETGDTLDPVICSKTETTSSIRLEYYLEVKAAAQYELDISTTCSRSGDSWGILSPMALIGLNRYKGGAGDPGPANPQNFDLANPPDFSMLTPEEIAALIGEPVFLENKLPDFVKIGNICSDNVGGSASVYEVINLAAPVEEGTTDLVYISLQFFAHAGLNHYAGFDISSYESSNPFTSKDKTAGSYSGTTDIQINVSLVPKAN